MVAAYYKRGARAGEGGVAKARAPRVEAYVSFSKVKVKLCIASLLPSRAVYRVVCIDVILKPTCHPRLRAPPPKCSAAVL